MENTISSFEDIEHNLKILNLRRKIALEEMKIAKTSLAHDLNPLEWMKPDLIKSASKLGMLYLLKKIFKV